MAYPPKDQTIRHADYPDKSHQTMIWNNNLNYPHLVLLLPAEL